MLSDKLREIRKEHKLTQQNIADVLGIDRTTYTVYELGTTTPSPSTLVKLSQIYNVTVGYLLDVEDNRPELLRDLQEPKAASVLGSDPLAFLKKDEKELLMYFRVLPPEKKTEVTQKLRDLAQNCKAKV